MYKEMEIDEEDARETKDKDVEEEKAPMGGPPLKPEEGEEEEDKDILEEKAPI
ncbi:hypothetical protein ES703_59841 [subsurface metagenome]